MTRRSFRLFAASWLLVGGAPLAARADLVIDTFETSQAVEVTPGGDDVVSGTVSAPEAIGGERDVVAQRLSGTGAVQFQAGVAMIEEMMCSAGAATQGACVVSWDGVDGTTIVNPDGLGGIDLTEGGANDAVAFAVQADVAVNVIVEVTKNDGGNTFVGAMLSLPGGDSTLVDRFLPLSAFGPMAQDVFTSAGSIALSVSGPSGFDVLVDDVRMTVPEPATGGAALAATGALAGLARRRRLAA